MFKFIKSPLVILRGIVDLQRFTKWKNDLEDALEKLETEYKKKKIRKKAYLQQKDVLQKKMERAEKLIKESKESIDKAKRFEIRF